MKTTTKIKSFVKEFTAVIKGDDVEILAQKVFRQADAALSTHIAILTGELIAKEDILEQAKESIALARVNNGRAITNNNNYVEELITAQNKLVEAEESLDAHKAKLEFLKTQLAELSLEVEA